MILHLLNSVFTFYEGEIIKHEFVLFSHNAPVRFKIGEYIPQHLKNAWKNYFKLQRHMPDIHSVKPFSCEKCGKVNLRKNILKRHMTDIHRVVKPFFCEECAKVI